MKQFINLLLFSIFLFNITYTNAQPTSIQWQKCFGGSYLDYGKYIIQTSDSGYFAVGETYSFNYDVINNHSQSMNFCDAFVVKLTSNYSTEWIKCFGGSQNDNFNSVIEMPNRGYLLSGSTESNDGNVTNNHGGTDGWVVRLDSTGAIIWQKCYGGTGSTDVITSTIQTNDGGFICSGYSNSNNGDVINPHSICKGWIFKIDSIGIIQWSKCYGDSIESEFYKIIQTNDGGYLIAGKKPQNIFFEGNLWILKINDIGDVVWQLDYGFYYHGINDIKQFPDGSFIAIGETHHLTYSYKQGLVLKISNNGVLEWAQNGTEFWGYYKSIQVNSDSTFIIGGYGNNGGNNTDYLLLKMSYDGNVIWRRYYGAILEDKMSSFVQTSDEGFMLLGSTTSYWNVHHGSYDMLFLKLSIGNSIDEASQIPTFQIFPNPTKDLLYFKVQPVEINLDYKIYSVTGKLVLYGKITSETMELQLGSISEGIYFLQVGNKKTNTLKFIKY